MRNLKKLFAVVMVVAMLASMMVPALAAGVEYEDEATILQDLGLFQGYGAGELGLADDLTREQGLALMLRVMGLEDEVKAMTEEEVAAELARVVDPETVTATWAKPYVAYAVKNGLTKGIDASILPNVKFAGQLKMTGKEFINLMLNGMGYATAWDDVLTKAAEVEMLSAGESVTFGTVKEMTRDQAVAIMFGALSGITSEGITLAQALVDAGAVDADKMEEYGFIVPEVVPTEAPVEITAEATTTNLIQINVEFNTEVDKDSAEDKDNYKIDDITISKAALQDDGSTVVLTLDFDSEIEQQDKVDLTIKGVKSVDGVEIDETTIEDIEFLDQTIPTVIDAQVVGKDTIKVIFSEPMNYDSKEIKDDTTTYFLNKAGFVVNNGKLYVRQAKLQNNNTEALVQLYSSLKEGELTLQVKSNSEDFAGFGVIGKLITLDVVKDEEAPVVIGYENAKQTEVTLIWNEDIEFDGKKIEEFYHTNSKNEVSDVTIDGNKTTLKFYKAHEKLLPEGTAYVYVLKEAVKDLWGNKNAQQMIQVEVVIDETAPEVEKVEQGDTESEVVVTYNEEMDDDETLDEDNYTILDEDGKEKKDFVDKVTFKDDDHKKVVLKLSDKLGGEYSVVIENVEDVAGNEIVPVTMSFTMKDKTAPVYTDFKAVLYNAGDDDQMLKISFGEKMSVDGKYAINDIEKYKIVTDEETKLLKKIDNVEINVVDNDKAIEIIIPSTKDDAKKGFDLKDGDELIVARVADAAGNYTVEFEFTLAIGESEYVQIKSAEATARDTIKLTFDDEVKFEISDFTVVENVYDLQYAEVETTLNSDGNTVATIKLDSKLGYTWADGYVFIDVVAQDDVETENGYGKAVESMTVNVKDKVKPELYDDGNSETKQDYLTVGGKTDFTVKLQFTEALDGDINFAFAGSDFEITVDNDKLVNGVDYEVIDISGDTVTFKFYGEKKSEGSGDDKVEWYELNGDMEIDLVEKPNHVKDLKGNKLDSFDTIEIDDIDFSSK